MLSVNQLVGFGGGGLTVNAVDYSGSSQYLTRTGAYTSGTTTGKGVFSCWFKVNGGDGTTRYFYTSMCFVSGKMFRFHVGLDISNKAHFILWDQWNSHQLYIETAATFAAGGGWNHILCNFDCNAAPGSRVYQLYINSAVDQSVVDNSGSAFTIPYADADMYHGVARGGTASPGSYHNGGLSEIWFAPGSNLDLSVTANREKFILGGKPAYLGEDGSLPLGSQPILYLKNPAATVNINSGFGGDLVTTGTPTVSATSPSD